MLAGTTTTWAQLYVCGKEVPTTGTTVQAVTGTGISGTVTYDPQNKYLKLKDATITASGSCDGIWNKGVEDLIILLEGTNKISTSSDGTNVAGIYCSKNTSISRFSGVHTPTVTVSNTGAGPAVKSTNGAEVEFFGVNATVTASNHHAIYADNAAKLVVLVSTLTAKTNSSSHYAITGFKSGMNMIFDSCPLAVFDNNRHSFDKSTGSVVSNGTPVQSTTLVPSIMIGDEALGYQTPNINTTTTGASSVSGSVRFNPNANPWLQLEDFSMTGKSITCRIPNLEIRIKGSNTITTTKNNTANIYIYGNTTFTGDGSLTLATTGTGVSALSTYNSANVTVNINGLTAQGTDLGFYGQKTGTLTLKRYSNSSIYRFLGTNCNVYTGKLVMDGMDIWSQDTYFNAGEYKMWKNGSVACGTYMASDGSIFQSTSKFTYYPVWVGGTQVNDRNYSNILSTYITGGTASYSSDSKTLTLNGVQLEATGTDAPNGISVGTGLDGITLNFSGADQHWTTDNDVLDIGSMTNITGNCERIYLTSNKKSGISTYGGASVSINTSGYLGAKGAKYGYYGNRATGEVLTLSKTSSDTYGYAFEGAEGVIFNVTSLKLTNMDFGYIDGLDYLPGCYFEESRHYVAQNGGLRAKGKVSLVSVKEQLPVYVAGKNLKRLYTDTSVPIYVGSPYITSGPKSVKYVPSTKTLTLTDATIVEHGTSNTYGNCGVAVTGDGVTINVEGTNDITAGNYGIYTSQNLTIGGSGNLNVTSTGVSALAIYDTSNVRTLTLQCSGGTHSFKGKTFGFCGWNTANLAIKKASGSGALYKFAGESADIGQAKNLGLGEGVKIHTRCSWFNTEANAIYRRSTISRSSDIGNGTWIRGDVEWIEYPLYICGEQLYGAIVDGNVWGSASGFCCKQYGGSGISYDPKTKTLTMDGVTIDDTSIGDVVHNAGIDGLKINMAGANNLKATNEIFLLDCNTTISGTGTVKGESGTRGFGITLSNTDLVLDGPTFEFKGRAAIEGGVGSNYVLINSPLIFEPNDHALSAFYRLNSVIFGEGLDITEPQGAYYSPSLKAVTTDGETAYKGKAVIGSVTPYDLTIAGVTVTSANCTDILKDGVFSYDPETQTLTISGDCSYNGFIVDSEIEGLTINVSGNSTLTQKYNSSILRLHNTTTITGGYPYGMKLHGSSIGASGIYISGGGALTIRDAFIEVYGNGVRYGITSDGRTPLVIDNSDIVVTTPAFSEGCISDWAGITLTNCFVEQPQVSIIKTDGIYGVKNVLQADGTWALEDYLLGSDYDEESLVIKAGEMTGIYNSGNVDGNLSDGKCVYDLQGRKVTNPEKGKIYIINGKKEKR